MLTPQSIRRANEFTYGPIKEVAYLFLGIFLTMMPALGYLQQHGGDFGFKQPTQYYLATGSLSSVLDNAPTYLNFLQLAQATLAPGTDDEPAASDTESNDATHRGKSSVQVLLEQHPTVVVAISLGAVFFGAMTYIGNGPNFMVKSIAQSAGVRMPTFFGFVFRFSLPILLPILIASGYLFLR